MFQLAMQAGTPKHCATWGLKSEKLRPGGLSDPPKTGDREVSEKNFPAAHLRPGGEETTKNPKKMKRKRVGTPKSSTVGPKKNRTLKGTVRKTSIEEPRKSMKGTKWAFGRGRPRVVTREKSRKKRESKNTSAGKMVGIKKSKPGINTGGGGRAFWGGAVIPVALQKTYKGIGPQDGVENAARVRPHLSRA